jgi:large subunit ribosomal protein L2
VTRLLYSNFSFYFTKKFCMKIYKPTSPGRRDMTGLDYRALLSGDTPHKPLLNGRSRGNGRNNAGRISMRHKGGGVKRTYRDIDFTFNKRDIPATITTIEYDPYRSAFVGIALYKDGERRYVVLPRGVKVGAQMIVSESAPITLGNRVPLKAVPVGTFVYNVEVRKVQDTCWASIGQASNEDYYLINYGKAGRNRKRGIRPTVRGTAMNPVDHPHGGGEGKQGRGLKRAKSLWGKPTGKGQKTRRPKKYSNVFVVTRRKVGKSK